MTGPEHYREAENLLKALEEASEQGGGLEAATVMAILAKAQVHATLANTASDALYTPDGLPERIYNEWMNVAG